MAIPQEVRAYNSAQSAGDKRICDALSRAIDQHLPGAESRIWHRHPVWFLDGNPVVGYSKLKGCIRLLFWSGQSFDEPGLAPEGSFKAAEARFASAKEIDGDDLKRWLAKAAEIQWDYKNIVKRKGRLEPLKIPAAKNGPARNAKKKARPGSEPRRTGDDGPVLLSGGNPQIAKGDGDAVVRAYIEAMPGWKREVGRGLDAIIVRTVPRVRKAVRWNSPFYGVEGRGWFLSWHCITRYVKVAFFRGSSLKPMPPEESKQKEVRYLHIHEGEWAALDRAQLERWIRQAAKLDGERCF
jgi:hypothetical protein